MLIIMTCSVWVLVVYFSFGTMNVDKLIQYWMFLECVIWAVNKT